MPNADANKKSIISVIEEASSEVRVPILNSTLIIIASFLPLFFLSGMEGKMLIPLGIAFIVALASSTIVALTLTPVLCSYLLRPNADGGQKNSKESWLSQRLKEGYAKLLDLALASKRMILTLSGIALVAAIIAMFIPTAVKA